MILGPAETVEESSEAPSCLSRVSGWLSGYEPDTPPGSPPGWSPISGPPRGPGCCPLALRNLALQLASRKGVPASPLRFDPGTPFLDQHMTDIFGEARCRVVSGSERAAVKLRVKNGKHDSREPHGGGARRRIAGRLGKREERTRGRRDGGWPDRAGRAVSVGRHVRRSVDGGIEGEAALAFPPWPLGRSFWRSTPWRRASLPLSARSAEQRSQLGHGVREPHDLAHKSSAYTPVQSPCVDFALAVVA
jgi:hypothetical protein